MKILSSLFVISSVVFLLMGLVRQNWYASLGLVALATSLIVGVAAFLADGENTIAPPRG